jgi:hypothetical protein
MFEILQKIRLSLENRYNAHNMLDELESTTYPGGTLETVSFELWLKDGRKIEITAREAGTWERDYTGL